MPWGYKTRIKKGGKKVVVLYDKQNGKEYGEHPSKAKAQAQMRVIEANKHSHG